MWNVDQSFSTNKFNGRIESNNHQSFVVIRNENLLKTKHFCLQKRQLWHLSFDIHKHKEKREKGNCLLNIQNNKRTNLLWGNLHILKLNLERLKDWKPVNLTSWLWINKKYKSRWKRCCWILEYWCICDRFSFNFV